MDGAGHRGVSKSRRPYVRDHRSRDGPMSNGMKSLEMMRALVLACLDDADPHCSERVAVAAMKAGAFRLFATEGRSIP